MCSKQSENYFVEESLFTRQIGKVIDDHFKWLDCIYGDACCPDNATDIHHTDGMSARHHQSATVSSFQINQSALWTQTFIRDLAGTKCIHDSLADKHMSFVWVAQIILVKNPMIAGQLQFIPVPLISSTNLCDWL